MKAIRFKDRREAGRKLGEALKSRLLHNPVILALPRGGVPVANEVSRALGIPFDVLIVRKVGPPLNREYGIGALAEDDAPLLTTEAFRFEEIDPEVEQIIFEEKEELQRRIWQYREGRQFPDVRGREVILIDDGLATGITAMAGGKFLKHKGAAKVILAVPVGPSSVDTRLQEFIDEVICLSHPPFFYGVGMWYDNFEQTSDEDVITLLRNSQSRSKVALGPHDQPKL